MNYELLDRFNLDNTSVRSIAEFSGQVIHSP
jgi:hypothetical protein